MTAITHMPSGAGSAATDTQQRELVLPVDGMTCASCVGRVEQALARVPGVARVEVNLASMSARVIGDPTLDPSALVAAIDAAGYETPRETVTLAISGMTCASCAGRVETAIARVPGVLEVEVNLATEKARVTLLPSIATLAELRAALARAGYDGERADAANAIDRRVAAVRRERAQLVGAALCTAPLLLNMLVELWRGTPMLTPWMQWLLATPVQFLFGARFFAAAWRALRAGTANMDLLVVLGTGAAYGLSVWLVLAGHADHSMHLYFEAAAVVITLILLGKWLEARAKAATGAAIERLAALRPTRARVLRDGAEIELAIDEVASGDIVVVRPAERIAVDGTIVDGTSEIDESLITGESAPVLRRVGDVVTGGAINGAGLLRVRATTLGSASRLARIIRLVERAQASKAPIQHLVDRVSAIFVPVVVAIAAITAAAWLLAGSELETAIIHAVAVLVISCPCALGLATPTAVSVGIGAGARDGILIKDAAALETARRIDTIVFDKTGTLTRGRPTLVAAIPTGLDESALIALAATAQQGSEHPLAIAIRDAARARAIALGAVDAFQALPGRGLSARVGGETIAIGNRALMATHGVDTAPLAAQAEALEARGCTPIWVARGEGKLRLAGLLATQDAPRPDAAAAVARLKTAGIRTVMLTGDTRHVAARVAATLGLDEVIAEVVPEAKAAEIRRLRSEGRVVAMVGDGINDAPALAGADLGVAMGGGTEAALEAAGAALMRDDLALLPALVDLSRRTQAKIRQNLFWAFVYNVVGIPFAAIGLLGPIVAGGAMALSSVSVVANALLLRRWRARPG